jgi:hypothetical protein
MTKVILLGDSIRLGYQARVAELLAGRASVTGPQDNCRFSAYTLFNLAAWVPDGGYDVIQWNNGQWDTCHMADGRIHTPLATYVELQERIADILAPKCGRLVFATTTPVWPEQFASGSIHPRRNEDIRACNAAATDLCRRLGIEVNDLHAALAHDLQRYIADDMVHLTEAGIEVCARRTAELIEGDGAA